MRIDKTLNLVIPLVRKDGVEIYVHSAPISHDVFVKYCKPIARTFNEIYTGGYGVVAGPRIAAMLLEDVAKSQGVWDTPDGVQRGLMAEIQRLTNIIAVGDRGWETIPLAEAKAKNIIEPVDVSLTESCIVFFIVASAMHQREQLPDFLESATKLWASQISSLNCTEFLNSLPTSTGAGNSGVRAAA